MGCRPFESECAETGGSEQSMCQQGKGVENQHACGVLQQSLGSEFWVIRRGSPRCILATGNGEEPMKWMLALVAAFVMMAAAADISGNWKATAEGPNGAMERTFVFKVDGNKVTGETVSTMMGKS